MTSNTARRLNPGDIVIFPDDKSMWKVERVGSGSATVKCLAGGVHVGQRHVEFRSGRSIDVEVWEGMNTPGRRLEISVGSLVQVME